MKIESIKVMRGPNYWSNYRKKLIVMKLDIESLEQHPTNTIEGFSVKMMNLMPSLIEHRCSEGHRGGFLERVEQGTWIGHVIEHIALELQSLAGMECGFGRTRSTRKPGVYNVVFSYMHEEAGLYAAHAAIRIAEALVRNTPYDLSQDIEQLKDINESNTLGPSTGSIVAEAERRGIPYWSYDKGSLIIFGHGVRQRKIQATITDATSFMGVDLVGDKDLTKRILGKHSIPVPKGVLIADESELEETASSIGYPLAVKPVDGNHGRGVSTNIKNSEELKDAFTLAKEISDTVVVEKFITGDDYRFLVINYKLVAVAKRTPPTITGDGYSTIHSLIAQLNDDPRRGEGHEKVLTRVVVDATTESILKEKNYTLETVLADGEDLVLKKAANLSSGGTSTDVTDTVQPFNFFLVERIARIMNMDICGIDVITKNVSAPITSDTGAIIEVNAAPGFRMHLSPSFGEPRNVAEHVINMFFPKEKSRIPIVAVTGTNGKTTTVRLVAHIAAQAGNHVGYTTTDGIYIQGNLVEKGDCTGPVSTETVLTDPTVDFAVLECARGGILRSGLGFDNCDISIITNISEDHLGLQDIYTLEDMANVKEVVARSTAKNGYTILNADDDLVYKMADHVDCNIALFSLYDEHGRVKKHCANGGLGALIVDGYVVVYKGKLKAKIDKVANIPLSFSGKAECMIKNILPAVLVGSIQRFKLADIVAALKSFIPSPELTPGRMNFFQFQNFDVMVDYAHNTGGFMEQKKFIESIVADCKVGIISAVGDRRDDDIKNVGYLSALIFDEIIIRLDKDLRGRTSDNILHLLHEGIMSGDPNTKLIVIPEETEALKYAINNGCKGAFIAIFSDQVEETIRYVTEAQRKERESLQPTLAVL